uniref:Secreted protein n=1 Tax=Globodera pallida TaxID=36090 RepID=A0A183CFF3_GLOPA
MAMLFQFHLYVSPVLFRVLFLFLVLPTAFGQFYHHFGGDGQRFVNYAGASGNAPPLECCDDFRMRQLERRLNQQCAAIAERVPPPSDG